MRRLIAAIALQCYALLLAWMQSLHGVATDEAKYLLDIPYPHPPLARFVLGFTTSWPYQELFWRVVFATLVVQAAWLVWGIAKGLSDEQRFTLAGLWLLSAAVFLQAGSIMMAPLTALQGLILVVLLFAGERRAKPWGAWAAAGIGLLWLISLLTAYQAVLYGPIVFGLLRRAEVPWPHRFLYLAGPVAVAGLVALAEPLILASFVNAGSQEAGIPLLRRFIQLFQAWSIGGSVILSIVGLMGMFLERRWELLASFLLVCAFLIVSFRLYYAILFLPLFIAGALVFLHHLWRHPAPVLLPYAAITLLCVVLFPISFNRSSARDTVHAITSREGAGSILIRGSFGHEWQYESPVPVRLFHPSLLPQARAVVCSEHCEDMENAEGWVQLPGEKGRPEAWVRE